MDSKILFSVTAKDCDWSYTRGTGAGGQKKNKTSSAVHCSHRASGAHGYAEDTRSQLSNKQLAFERMALTKEFKKWHASEVGRLTGETKKIEEQVAYEIRHNVRIEKREEGRWVPYEDSESSVACGITPDTSLRGETTEESRSAC